MEVRLTAHKAGAAERKRNEERLKKIMKDAVANSSCVECMTPVEFRTGWASINLGVFICAGCSGIHRSLGTHLSRVKSVAADDWNDDWVDQMEKWGNARSTAVWEARAPPRRPTAEDGRTQSHFLKSFITAKYDERRGFAAVGDPNEWYDAWYTSPPAMLPLERGWVRYIDEASGACYDCHEASGETSWDLPPAARLAITVDLGPSHPGRKGWLDKKSGGKEGKSKLKMLQSWDKRYFVLPPGDTELRYFKGDEDFRKGAEALGTVSCAGASMFLKEVTKDQQYRFTLRCKGRELKLRASSKVEYDLWSSALQPIVGSIGAGGEEDDDDAAD